MDDDDQNILFNEEFRVIDINCDLSVAENVNRIHCEGRETQTDLLLDLYSPVFNVAQGELLKVLLVKDIQSDISWDPDASNGLNMELYGDFGRFTPVADSLDTSSILKKYDKYEYIMYGKIYKIEDKMIARSEPIISVYASFGGLFFRLQSSLQFYSNWHIDNNLYLLIRRT